MVLQYSSNKRRIGTAALIRGRRLLTFSSQVRRLFEGGAYSGEALIRVKTLPLLLPEVIPLPPHQTAWGVRKHWHLAVYVIKLVQMG